MRTSNDMQLFSSLDNGAEFAADLAMMADEPRPVPTVHNPTNFEPSDYAVEDYLDNRRPFCIGSSRGAVEEYRHEVAAWEAGMERALGANWRAKMNRCIHCGNGTVRWITAVRHKPTNEVVVFGAVCTKRLGFEDRHAFKLAQLQARADARKVRFTIWTEREAFVNARPELRAAIAQIDNPEHAKNFFAQDVLRRLDQYGSLSDKQVNAVIASLARDVEQAKQTADQVAEEKGPAPSGRVQVTGTVLSTKLQENDFGVTLKMLVKLENNSKVWVSVPSKEVVDRGDVITFVATFEVSRDDASFAFGKRPHLVNRKVQA